MSRFSRSIQRPTLDMRAHNKTESANPGLWDGLVGAWVPALGVPAISPLASTWMPGSLAQVME